MGFELVVPLQLVPWPRLLAGVPLLSFCLCSLPRNRCGMRCSRRARHILPVHTPCRRRSRLAPANGCHCLSIASPLRHRLSRDCQVYHSIGRTRFFGKHIDNVLTLFCVPNSVPDNVSPNARLELQRPIALICFVVVAAES